MQQAKTPIAVMQIRDASTGSMKTSLHLLESGVVIALIVEVISHGLILLAPGMKPIISMPNAMVSQCKIVLNGIILNAMKKLTSHAPTGPILPSTGPMVPDKCGDVLTLNLNVTIKPAPLIIILLFVIIVVVMYAQKLKTVIRITTTQATHAVWNSATRPSITLKDLTNAFLTLPVEHIRVTTLSMSVMILPIMHAAQIMDVKIEMDIMFLE